MWVVIAVVVIFFWAEYQRAKKLAGASATPGKTRTIGGTSAPGNQWDNGSAPTIGPGTPCDSARGTGLVFATAGGEEGGSPTARSTAIVATPMILGKHNVLLAGGDPPIPAATPTAVSGVKNAVTHTRRSRRSS